jgi:hypothetical protein
MITKEIIISKMNGKVLHLSDIYPVIETNTILNKTITGIGATYSEIKASRHSIIIEPTRPVIYGKTHDPKHKDDNLKGVCQGVYQDEIADYIETSLRQHKWIKILTTPESFRKVQESFKDLDIDIRFDGYFLLFDECQKMVKDCDYRSDITLPMDLFFQCRDKAIVSATPPTQYADMRFNDFQMVKLCPDYDYQMDFQLYTTNNVLQRTRELLESLESDESPVFFFVNSTDMIWSLMKQLGVRDESAVFCSEKSVNKLRGLKFRKAYEDWEVKRMERYNWLTSRFNSAFDIELQEVLPNVVMLTDCYIADYTMIDPYMDAVQIVGRFRNGVNRIYHISNCDKRNPIKSRGDIAESVREMKIVYDYMGTMAYSASTATQREEFRRAQATIPFTQFLDENGQVDPYKVDNYIDEETMKVTYNNYDSLLGAYQECGYFNVNHTSKPYKFGDYERLKIESKAASIREKRKEIVAQLEQLGTCDTELECQFKRDLEFADHLIVEAYDLIGKAEIERLRYSVTKIRKAVILKKHQMEAHATDAIQLINSYFHPQQWYSAKTIKEKIKEIFAELNIPTTKAVTSHTINEYFEAREQRKRVGRGYFLIAPRFV